MKLYREKGGELVSVPLERGVYHAVFTVAGDEAAPPEPEPEVEPEPEPEPTPEPEPETEPEPPVDPGTRPRDIVVPMNTKQMVVLDEFINGRYIRYQHLVVWKNDVQRVRFKRFDQDAGGAVRALAGSEYTLYLDGNPMGKAAPSGTNTGWLDFTIDLTDVDDGWHMVSTNGFSGETPLPYPVFVLRNELPEQDWMPVVTPTQGMAGATEFHIRWVPCRFDPVINPLTPRNGTPFDTTPSNPQRYYRSLTGSLSGAVRRPNLSKDGVWNTFCSQSYTWASFVARWPRYPLLDGPRGLGTLNMVSHIQIGDARIEDRPDSPLMGNFYATDPWRLVKVHPDGTIQTLVGYRTKGNIPRYWETASIDDVELVGDWSAIPEERWGCRELWAWVWKRSTLKVDHSADPIPHEGNRQPHHRGNPPQGFLFDSQKHRILGVEFDPLSHDTPAKVTEFLTGINEPWDGVAWDDDQLIVSERKDHRVCQYDMNTGRLVRVILQGKPLASVNTNNRFVTRHASLEEIRAEDIVLPEGLDILGDWLYVGSVAMQQVKRVHLKTGEIEVVCQPPASPARHFFKIAVSDGTAGPKGAVFVANWTVSSIQAFLPDGRRWKIDPWDRLFGVGTNHMTAVGYSSAFAANHGKVIRASSGEGLQEFTLAQEDDFRLNRTQFLRGREAWAARGYNLTRDPNAQSFFGEGLPWSETVIDAETEGLGVEEAAVVKAELADIDYMLEALQHTRPETQA